MGLDYIELIMRVEETFNISITDDDAGAIVTVDQLYRHVLCKLEAASRQACLTSFVFYRIRRAGIKIFDMPRQQFRPEIPLEILVPIENRRARWKSLSDQLALSLPPLVIPDLLHLSVMISWRLCLALGLGVAWATPPDNHWGIVLIAGAILWGLSASRICSPFATEFPVPTLGALTNHVLANNFTKVSRIQKQWHESEVWEVLKATIVDELGLQPEDVVPQARFYEDFNAG